jgi:chromosome segregation ATPase
MDDQSQAMYGAFEEEKYAKEQEIRAGLDVFTERLDAIEEEVKELRKAQHALQRIDNELKIALMESEEAVIDIEIELEPLWALWNELGQAEQRSAEDADENQLEYNRRKDDLNDEIRQVQDQMKEGWDEAQNIDHGVREELRNQANAEHQAKLEELNQLRSDSFSQADNSDNAAQAEEKLAILETQYEQNRASWVSQLETVNLEIEQLSAAATDDTSGGDGGADRSAIIAALESNKSDLDTAKVNLSETPSTIAGEETRNVNFDGALAARDDAQSQLTAAKEELATRTVTRDETAPTNEDGSVNEAYTEADTAVASAQTAVDETQAIADAAESSLANTPKTLPGSEDPNPAYTELEVRIRTLELAVAGYETQLENAGEVTGSGPELTAAYTKQSEYETILKELEVEYVSEQASLRETVDAGDGQQSNIKDVERFISDEIREADEKLRATLAQIDTDSYGDSEKPEIIVLLENESAQLEAKLRAVEAEEQAAHKNREDRQRALREEKRAVEDLIFPLEDRRKEVWRNERPLHKQQIALDRERILMEPLQDETKMKREPIEKEWREYEEPAWKEFEKWQGERQKEVEKELQTLRQNAEQEIRAQFDAVEKEQYALQERLDQAEEDFREEFKGKRRELEDQVDELREEKFRPMEEAVQALNGEIEDRWVVLESLYEQKNNLTGQLEKLEARVRNLDRQAEFGVLEVISGAMENVGEMEKSGGGFASFDQFLPQIDGGGSQSE